MPDPQHVARGILERLQQVQGEMDALGVNRGVLWATITGSRTVMVEREFDSLSAYETDDAAFHGSAEFMALWRRMEELAESMDTQLWRTRHRSADSATLSDESSA